MNSDQLQLNEKMDDAFVADFEFSCTPSSMRFNESLREIYGISEYNISLPEDCLGGWFPGWRSVMKLAFKEVSCGFCPVNLNQLHHEGEKNSSNVVGLCISRLL